MKPGNLSVFEKEFVKIKKYLSSLYEENNQLKVDILTVKYGLNKVSGAFTQLEKCVSEIETDLAKSQERIGKLIKYIERKEQEHKKLKASRIEETQMERIENYERNDTEKAPDSVMIFISPDLDDTKSGKDDSTRQSRRQLMPLPEEEELILRYLNEDGHRITQKEYNKLLKEISSMLISAPKNVIAIELKKKESDDHKKNLELCYHIKVKDTLSQACFKYFQYKGKTSPEA